MPISSPLSFRTRPKAVRCRTLLIAVLVTGLTPAAARAQGDDDSHFGAGVSFTPNWKSRTDLLTTIGLESGDVSGLEGSEFTVGFVRGRTRGGEWGVSFVRKAFKDAATVVLDGDSGECGPGCTFSFSQIRTTRFESVYVRGIEVHWAPAFVTIGDRVQIGMNIAGGIGVPEGTIHEDFLTTNSSTFMGQTFTNTNDSSSSSPARDVLFGKIPLFKVEAQGAVILAPGLKLKISGGLNNPGMGIRIGAVYLFGAN